MPVDETAMRVCRVNGHFWNEADRSGARTCANGCGTLRWDYADGSARRYEYAPGYLVRKEMR
jgi:hypothetical protein